MIAVTGATGFFVRSQIKKLMKEFNKKDILCLVYDIFDKYFELENR